jgi:hypothetical protein
MLSALLKMPRTRSNDGLASLSSEDTRPGSLSLSVHGNLIAAILANHVMIDAKCGFACHTIVKANDYVFTAYGEEVNGDKGEARRISLPP